MLFAGEITKEQEGNLQCGLGFPGKESSGGESEETLGIPVVSGPVGGSRQRRVRRTPRSSSDSEPKQRKSGKHGLCR